MVEPNIVTNKEAEEALIKIIKEGVFSAMTKLFILIIVGFSAGSLIGDYLNGDKKSTVRIHVDPDNGCEYMAGEDIGITPRLDNKGYQVGCK